MILTVHEADYVTPRGITYTSACGKETHVPYRRLKEFPLEDDRRSAYGALGSARDDEREELWAAFTAIPANYGVADCVEQVLAKFPWYVQADREFILNYYTLTPATHPGWRWHKHGPYVGEQQITHEHLGDETHIAQIIAWRVLEVLPEPAP